MAYQHPGKQPLKHWAAMKSFNPDPNPRYESEISTIWQKFREKSRSRHERSNQKTDTLPLLPPSLSFTNLHSKKFTNWFTDEPSETSYYYVPAVCDFDEVCKEKKVGWKVTTLADYKPTGCSNTQTGDLLRKRKSRESAREIQIHMSRSTGSVINQNPALNKPPDVEHGKFTKMQVTKSQTDFKEAGCKRSESQPNNLEQRFSKLNLAREVNEEKPSFSMIAATDVDMTDVDMTDVDMTDVDMTDVDMTQVTKSQTDFKETGCKRSESQPNNLEQRFSNLNQVREVNEEKPSFSMIASIDADIDEGISRCKALPEGVLELTLRLDVVVQLTLDGGARIICGTSRCVVAVNGPATALAVLHSVGRVFQDTRDVRMITHGPPNNKKYATFLATGIRFTSDLSSMGYSLEPSGLRPVFKRTCTEMFQDFTFSVFVDQSRYGTDHIGSVITELQDTKYKKAWSGNETWLVGDIIVTQSARGHVRVERQDKGFELSLSPTQGTVFANNRFVHCTADNRAMPHIFVKQDKRKVYFDAQKDIFEVRYGAVGAEMNHLGQGLLMTAYSSDVFSN